MADPADDARLKKPGSAADAPPVLIPDYVAVGSPAEQQWVLGFTDGWEECRAHVKSQPHPRQRTIVVAPWPHEAHERGKNRNPPGAIKKSPPKVPVNEHGDDGEYDFDDPLAPGDPTKRKKLTSLEQNYTQAFQYGWTAFASNYVKLFLD